MLTKLFKKAQTIFPKTKNISDVVAEIHDSFNTEVDKLLADCGITIEQNKGRDLSRANRLMALGFNQAKGVVESREIERITDESNRLLNAITYFSNKYPQYKFITKESVMRICEKYNLHCGVIGTYTGDVPDKNLAEIERFRIDDNDRLYIRYGIFSKNQVYTLEDLRLGVVVGYDDYKRIYEAYNNDHSGTRAEKSPLFICAPKKDFNIPDKNPIPDPVVLQPVWYRHQYYFLVVTAWGAEASDPDVVNQKMN